MRIPVFKEVVVLSERGTVYVFPTNDPNVVFIWDKHLSEKDWGYWHMVKGDRAYKIVL